MELFSQNGGKQQQGGSIRVRAVFQKFNQYARSKVSSIRGDMGKGKLRALTGTLTRTEKYKPTNKQKNGFPKFLELPAEIRLQIWKLALPSGGRILKIQPPWFFPPKVTLRGPKSLLRRAVVSFQGLEMLHACAESRAFILEKYTLLKPYRGLDLEKPFYFCAEIDTIYFKNFYNQFHWVRSTFQVQNKDLKVRRVAIAIYQLKFNEMLCLARGIKTFKYLKELILVVQKGDDEKRLKWVVFQMFLVMILEGYKDRRLAERKMFNECGVSTDTVPLAVPKVFVMNEKVFLKAAVAEKCSKL